MSSAAPRFSPTKKGDGKPGQLYVALKFCQLLKAGYRGSCMQGVMTYVPEESKVVYLPKDEKRGTII